MLKRPQQGFPQVVDGLLLRRMLLLTRREVTRSFTFMPLRGCPEITLRLRDTRTRRQVFILRDTVKVIPHVLRRDVGVVGRVRGFRRRFLCALRGALGFAPPLTHNRERGVQRCL